MRYPSRFANRYFNMVEIILAMVIILVGVLSIMALFPVGGEATQSAIGRNNASDAGDQFLRYFSSKLKDRWAITNALPITKPGPDESPINWQSVDSGGTLTGTHTGVQGVQFFYNDLDNDSLFDYKIEPPTNLTRDDTGYFMVLQRTSENIEDFSGVIRVWKTPATYSSYDTAADSFDPLKPVPLDAGITLNIEVSWPSQLPYERRERAAYSMSVFRPTEFAIQEVAGAFQIQQSGKLKITYHGSDAGWNSALHAVVNDEDVEVFSSNQSTDQTTTLETEYTTGTSFNFYTETTAGCCGYGVYKHYAWAELPTDCECKCRHIDGALNINPNNSSQNEFVMRKPDGSTITRDDLHQRSPMTEGGVFYEGKADYVRVKPKGNGNQNTFLVDDVIYLLQNKDTYVFEGDMDVVIYNDHVKKGKAMGHWWISTKSGCATVRKNSESHDELCPMHSGNTHVASVPYFDNPPNSYDGAYHHATGNPYALVTDLEPGRKWLIRFEDLPGDMSWIDWDYNDVVITVELIVDDGVAEKLANVPVSGTVDLQGDDTWRVSVLKTDGTMITDSELKAGMGYDGSVAAIWFRPGGTGTQSITAGSDPVSFLNTDLVSVCGEGMTARIYESGGGWKADIATSQGFFTIMR